MRKPANRLRNPKVKELAKDAPSRVRHRSTLNVYCSHHLWVAVSSLGQLWRTPLSTLMTSAVIAISLALPFGLHILLSNVQQLSGQWQNAAQISLYLKQGISDAMAKQLKGALQRWDGVESIHYVSPQQALEEFKQQSGFGDALELLQQNPLPAVLIVKPTLEYNQPVQLDLLVSKLQQHSAVEEAQLDMQWVKRLSAMIQAGERAVLLLASLLGVGVLLVIGNTIRLTIYNRRQEIVVTKLIGATNRFIRRPFLYTGLWYGLFGAILAWFLVVVFLALLKGPLDHLAFLYNSTFTVGGVDFRESLLIIATGVFLGLGGAWLAVGRHLQAIEPK
ncbi:MAG: permease-like cell division protein FtsX [Gammaproteobacteria bacterium]|nr:permease-like cell division protein FtsX [Gammaproteobacteria bacterium]MDH5802143.1 permease-like cell division protein FtsX [Gammaproteobacteria bacterium]